MKPPEGKWPHANSAGRQPERPATNARTFKPAVAQAKNDDAPRAVGRPTAPHAFAPQSKPSAAQLKAATPTRGNTPPQHGLPQGRPVAPPAYRPQATPRCLQMKSAGGPQLKALGRVGVPASHAPAARPAHAAAASQAKRPGASTTIQRALDEKKFKKLVKEEITFDVPADVKKATLALLSKSSASAAPKPKPAPAAEVKPIAIRITKADNENVAESPQVVASKFPVATGNATDLASDMVNGNGKLTGAYKVSGKNLLHSSAHSSMSPGTAFWTVEDKNTVMLVAMGRHKDGGDSRTHYGLTWVATTADVKAAGLSKGTDVVI